MNCTICNKEIDTSQRRNFKTKNTFCSTECCNKHYRANVKAYNTKVRENFISKIPDTYDVGYYIDKEICLGHVFSTKDRLNISFEYTKEFGKKVPKKVFPFKCSDGTRNLKVNYILLSDLVAIIEARHKRFKNSGSLTHRNGRDCFVEYFKKAKG